MAKGPHRKGVSKKMVEHKNKTMRNNKQYQKLEKIIKEACPETMELKIGCEVEVEIYGGMNPFIFLGSEDKKLILKKKDDYKTIMSPPDTEHNRKFIKILSSPLQLHHLLRAIDKTDLTKLKQYREEKWTMPEFAGHIVLKLIDLYDLTKSLKENCENDTLANFLYEIFNIEEFISSFPLIIVEEQLLQKAINEVISVQT